MRRALRLLPAAWLVLLLLLPLAAWVLGSRQTNIENRPPTPVPALNRGTLPREETFAQLDKAIVDRLPLRQHAVEARGRLAVELFHDSPSADVVIGRDGYLYYRPELQACTPEFRPAADPADAAEIMARTIVASGRSAGVLVAGSKVATHTKDVRGLDEDALACTRRLEARIHDRLRRAPGGLDVQARLDALERRGVPTFLRNDTHWNAAAREAFVRAVLDRIRPGMADEAGLALGPTIERPGDLGPFLGLERTERDRTVVAPRTPARPLPAGDVLLLGDSQLDRALLDPIGTPSLRDRVLPGQPDCTWPQLNTGGCDTPIQRARTVVTEIVGRNVRDLVYVCWRPVWLVGGDLRGGRPAAWERTDGAPQAAGAVTLGPDGQARARVRTPGPDVRDVPRLLRIPVRTLPAAAAGQPPAAIAMTQEPQAGPAAPCSTPAQSVEGGFLYLPVPAGRRASDLVVRLSGPAGAVLGRPEELPLDGTTRTARR